MKQSLYNVENYDESGVYEAICKIMADQDIASDLKPEMKIVIKPNLIMGKNPSHPTTTHPAVIRAVAKWLREQGCENITLAESSGGLYDHNAMRNVYHTCQVDTLSDVLTLNDNFEATTVFSPEGFKCHSFHLINPIVEADYIINICKLKTHAMTMYSGGIKNLFGTIPGLEKPQMHYMFPNLHDFSNMLVELSQVVAPNLTIVDAIDAMEGNGPTGGDSHPLHMLLGARDHYTQDWFAAGLMKIEPTDVEMIKIAKEKGLVHEDEIELLGDPIPDNLTPFKIPDAANVDFSSHVPAFIRKPFLAVAKKLFRSYPAVDKAKCVGCAKCAESCPAHIIKIENKKAIFTKKGCISCFCCQEMCPMKAIYVKKRF